MCRGPRENWTGTAKGMPEFISISWPNAMWPGFSRSCWHDFPHHDRLYYQTTNQNNPSFLPFLCCLMVSDHSDEKISNVPGRSTPLLCLLSLLIKSLSRLHWCSYIISLRMLAISTSAFVLWLRPDFWALCVQVSVRNFYLAYFMAKLNSYILATLGCSTVILAECPLWTL